jgi:hypothetical protein
MQPVRVDGEFLVHATYLNCCLKMSLTAQKWARATKVSTTAISLNLLPTHWDRMPGDDRKPTTRSTYSIKTASASRLSTNPRSSLPPP